MSRLSDTFRRRAAKPKDGQQTTALHLAVAEKNIDAVREMLTQGNEDLFAPDAQNRTPLIIAAENNDLETAALLLDYDTSGIDLFADHGTALSIAARRGFLDMAQLLLDRGAASNAGDADGTTPVMTAVFQKQHAMLEWLLAQGADTAAKRTNNENALHFAAMNNDVKALSLLLAHGGAAGINQRSLTAKHTPLMKAVQAGSHEATTALLAAGADPNVQDSQARTALHQAVEKNDTRMIYQLVVKGHADINKVDSHDSSTPLHTAVFEEHLDSFDMLLRLGADPHQPDGQKRSPLVQAGYYGHLPITKYILENVPPEPDADIAAARRAEALYDALFYGHTEVAHYLLDSGKVDVNHKVRDSDFVLQAAVRGRDIDLVKKIIDLGADLNAANKAGARALSLTHTQDDLAIATLLLQKGADANLPCDSDLMLHSAVEAGKTEKVTLLLAHGANPDARDQYNRTAIDVARVKGRANLVPLLQSAAQAYGKEQRPATKNKRFQGPKQG